LFAISTSAQTNYSPLYTSSNFEKTIDLTRPVGTVAGAAGTTPSGGVSYTIPIYTPPGTNGMQPSVSIVYNSQGSSGVVGFGWSIAGLSVISRTGKNIYHNGQVKPVSYTADDAFLLDGMRLNAIAGSNGANGTEYAGEAESFTKIISNSSVTADNPDWFLVTAKDGSTMEFGNTADSRILTDDGLNVMLWRLNRIIDINGNYIDFRYDNTSRDSRIDEINYTGNITTGLLPYNKIKFTYGYRNEVNTGYDGGASLNSLYLLNNITITQIGDDLEPLVGSIKKYQFNYGFDNVHSLLKEVVESGEGIGSGVPLLNSTIFLYGDQPTNLTTEAQPGLAGEHSFYSGDFDADGKSDLLLVESYFNSQMNMRLDTKIQLYKDMNGSGGTLMYQKNLPQNTLAKTLSDKNFYNFLASDYDKDGRDDVLQLNLGYSDTYNRRYFNHVLINYTRSHNTSTSYYDYNEVQFPAPPGDYKYIHQSGNFFIPGDFDGDGVQDYLLVLAKAIPQGNSVFYDYRVFLTMPGKNIINQDMLYLFSNGSGSLAEITAAADIIMPLDADGDGKQELLVTKATGSLSYILPIQGSIPFIGSTTEIVQGCKVFPGDFNGDRKTDFLVRNTNNTWKILYSTGKDFTIQSFSFNQSPDLSGQGYCADRIVISDFNGDGKSDILHGISNNCSATGVLSTYYSKGFSFRNEVYTMPWALSSSFNATNPFATGDFNGDGRADLLNIINNTGAGGLVFFKPDGKERLLQKVTDGHNNTIAFDYKLLTDKNSYPYVYTRTVSLDNPANQNPFNYVQLPMQVVSAMTVPDGIGGTSTTSFNYEDAVVHRQAKGFLGFKKITAINPIMGIKTITENKINTQWAVPYQVKQTSIRNDNGSVVSESFITNSFVNFSTGGHDVRYFQKIDKTLEVDHLNGKAAETVNTYDSYGNVITTISKVGITSGSTVTATETTTSTTTYGYHNTPVPAKPDQVTVSNVRTGMPAISVTSIYTYALNGNPATQTSFAGLPKAVTTAYTYNALGNVLQTTTSASGVSNRLATATYDGRGRYPLTKQMTDGTINQTETFTYDSKWGKPLSQKSIECNTTTFEYDKFGRLKTANMPEGYAVNTSLHWDVQGQQLFYTFTDFPGGKPDSKTWVDKGGRAIKSQTMGFNGQWLTQLTTYDAKGNVATKTNGYYSNEAPLITTSSYDVYNRPVSVSNSINTLTTSYTPLGNGQMQVTSQNSAGQSSSKTSDAAGKIITAIDNGGQLSYTYDSRGNQVEVKHGTTTMVTSEYDLYGRQTKLTDKNAGEINYNYDAYGQLISQTDALSNTYIMNYDGFGRMITRSSTEGTTTYEYNLGMSLNKCKGHQLKKVTGFNGVTKEYTYDGLRRLQTEKTTVDGTSFTNSYTYDGYSNPSSTTFSSGIVVNNVYDNSGNLIAVNGGDSWNPVNLFTANAENGYGQLTSYTLGNGKTSLNTYQHSIPTRLYTPGVQDLNLTFDYTRGNLLSRYDAIKNLTETFQYDNLDRLTTSTVNGVQQLSINFDGSSSFSMGNIASKTDAGNYVYLNDKVHAVAYITNPAGLTAPPITITPVQQQIAYTPFLKTASITEGSVQTNFTYGPDYQRIKTEMLVSGTINTTKYFLGGFERIINGSTVRDIHYIPVGNSIAIIEKYPYSNCIIHFVYTDYLGSLLTSTDINGTITAEQNFDAWGRQRNPNDWQYAGIAITPSFFDRGYTGHEMLPYHYLINMNGRIYDPIQGRMLSPDNYVPDPWHTQGYNRYSYANNNPLKYTDPDGNFMHLIIGGLIGGIVNLVSSAIQGRIHSWGDAFKSFGIGAIQGAIGAAIGYGGFGTGAAETAVSKGFLVSASNVGKNLASKIFLGSIATGIGSSFIPSIPFGDNFSVSPSFAFGSHGLSGGLNARFRSGNFSFGVGFNNSGSNAGWSAGTGWDNGKTGISYSFNHFSGGAGSQNTGTVGFRAFGRITGSWENDRFAGKFDRWRTNGMGLGYGFKNGSRAFIGSRFMTGQDDGGEYSADRSTYNEIEGSRAPREGLFYASFYNRNGIGASAGVDWEHGMHQVQNGMHDLLRNFGFNDWYFPSLGRPIGGFFRYGNSNPFTYFH
jgi:RHS repeat-associated protein